MSALHFFAISTWSWRGAPRKPLVRSDRQKASCKRGLAQETAHPMKASSHPAPVKPRTKIRFQVDSVNAMGSKVLASCSGSPTPLQVNHSMLRARHFLKMLVYCCTLASAFVSKHNTEHTGKSTQGTASSSAQAFRGCTSSFGKPPSGATESGWHPGSIGGLGMRTALSSALLQTSSRLGNMSSIQKECPKEAY